MQAIILSGGKGTRLYPLTKETPKPMLPINGKPHLEYQIRLLALHGITDIIFSTGYLHEKIEEYFGDGHKFGVNIQYKEDGDSPLGTAGAIKNCEDLITSENFLVLNGDILTDIDLTAMIEHHEVNKHPITIALSSVENPSSFGVAVLGDKGKIIEFVEKPKEYIYGNLINSGIYIIKKGVLFGISDEEPSMFEADVFPTYAKQRMIMSFVEPFYWLDIGTLDRYDQAQNDAEKYFS